MKSFHEFELSRERTKEIKRQIMQEFRVYVTTCGTASNQRVLFSDDCFKQVGTDEVIEIERVLFDEATMIKESDSVVPLKKCKQLVLIGDQ